MRRRWVLILFLISCLLPRGAEAVVSCHCFQDRAFDPARPAAADEYFLATVQNSLMAAAFDISKRWIVQVKMGGLESDLVWVAGYVSDRTGVDVERVVETWETGDWRGTLLKESTGKGAGLDPPFLAALSSGGGFGPLADGAFRSVMEAQLGVDPKTLQDLDNTAATRQEKVMAVLLSLLLAEDPVGIYREVAAGRTTWSESLAGTGLAADRIESVWGRLIRLQRERT